MSKRSRWVALAALILLSGAVAQSEVWSGLTFGLPEEAAGIALYLLDVDALERAGEDADVSKEMLVRVSPGELLENGTFKLSANTAAALETGLPFSAQRLMNLLMTGFRRTSLTVIPKDAKLAFSVFGIENRRKDLLGGIFPRVDDVANFVTPVLTFEPTLIEGVYTSPGDEPNDEAELEVVIAARRGFNALAVTPDPAFSNLTYRATPQSPQAWTYEAIP